jgi:hypothetical protein
MGLEYISQPQFFTAPVNAVYAEIATLSGLNSYIQNLSSENVLITNLSASFGNVDTFKSKNSEITKLNAVDGYFVNLTAENVRVINVTAENIKVLNLTGNNVEVLYFDVVDAYAENLTAANVNISGVSIVSSQIQNLTGISVSLSSALIESCVVQNLTANNTHVQNLNVASLTANNLFATKYFLIPETKVIEASSTIILPTDTTDIELSSNNIETITNFLSAVRGVLYTLTNKGTYNISISSSPTVFVRNGTAWRSNTSSLSTAFLQLTPKTSCNLRGDVNFVSVW